MQKLLSTAFAVAVLIPSLFIGLGSEASTPLCETPTALGCEVWIATYDGPSVDRARDVAVSPDGSRLFVTGESSRHVLTVAYEAATGTHLWEARDTGEDSPIELQAKIAVSPDGTRVFVAAERYTNESASSVATLAYDALTGEKLWEAIYAEPGKNIERPTAIAISPDGERVYVAADSRIPATKADFATLAYDAVTGDEVFVGRFDTLAHDFDVPSDIEVSPNGSVVYVTGRAVYAPPHSDYATVAYVARDRDDPAREGQQLWVSSYDGAAKATDQPWDLTVSPDGHRVYVTGQSAVGGGGPLGVAPDFATLALDVKDGSRVWLSTYDGGVPAQAMDVATGIAVSGDGLRVFVTGYGYGTGTRSTLDAVTLAYAAGNGERMWTSRYDGITGVDDIGIGIAVDDSGENVYVAGHSAFTAEHGDYQTLRYDASTGTQEWMARHKGQTADVATAMVLDPAGTRLYVTGYTWISGGRAPVWVTAAYPT